MQNPLAIFDLDGTLIDSAGDIQHALNLLLAEFGCAPVPLHEVRNMIGDGASQLIRRGLAARQPTAPDLGAALRRFVEHYAADPVARTEIYPGVLETLQRLQDRGIALAVCTNKPIGLSETILERLALARYFSTVLGGDSRPYRKPDPRILQDLLQEYAVSPQQAVLVGDSEIDAAAAQAAGVPFILVTYGYHRTALDTIPCRIAVDRFVQVGDFIPQKA
jgi:phosphoglycolate phosphatase